MGSRESIKPLLLISGFLGAGKTTLLRRLVAGLSQREVKADVILNDVANAELDVASVDPDQVSSITPIGASCACCESLDDLMRLCKRAAEGIGDALLIELNGTADPLGMVESLTLLEKQMAFAPIMHLCVIDVRNWGERGGLTRLERRQMEASELFLLSHADQAEQSAVETVQELVTTEFPRARQVTVQELVDTLGRGVEVLPDRDPDHLLGRQESDDGADLDSVHLLSHQVKGFQFPLPPKVRRHAILRLLEDLPGNVLRAKALVRLQEEPGRPWLFERSGQEVSKMGTPIQEGLVQSASLMCVGTSVEPTVIRGLIEGEFGVVPCAGP